MRFMAVVAALLLAACDYQPATRMSIGTTVGTVDCGTSDLRPPDPYDSAAQQCFWTAYSAGTPAQWSVIQYTTEGDPTPETLTFVGGVLVMTRDMTRDRFSNAASQRVWTWRCTTVQQRSWATNPQRYFLELSNCSGDGATTSFP